MNAQTPTVPHVVRSQQIEWRPLVEPGVKTDGILVKVLRFDPRAQRAPSILLKFAPGASYPRHNHPSGEELYVVEGDVDIAGLELSAGDYLYTPPNGRHAVSTKEGCVLLFIVPDEVQILPS